MQSKQAKQSTKEIAPDIQASWGDSKCRRSVFQSLAYIKGLALDRGINVHKTKDGFLITQWNMTKHVSTDAELLRLLQKIGVKL